MQMEWVKHLGGYRLAVGFNDGTSGEVDLESTLTGILEPLRDKTIFETVFVEHGVVRWLNGEYDLAPEYLYSKAHGLPFPQSFEEVDAMVNEMRLRRLFGQYP